MLGESAALGAALLWAYATILFANISQHIRAINLNLFKGIIACVFICITLACGSTLGIESITLQTLASINGSTLILLLISGVIGIGLGDTAYFACLKRIGPQRGIMLGSTAPILAAFFALFLFDEHLQTVDWLGIFCITIGVMVVVRLTRSASGYRLRPAGILFGLMAAACQAMGIVLSRLALLSGDVEPMAGALVRLGAAMAVIILWIGCKSWLPNRASKDQTLKQAMSQVASHSLGVQLFYAIFLGTFLAIWLMMLAVQNTSAGITQALIATCPLFTMLIGVFQGQHQPPLVWVGLALGLSGIFLFFIY